jgi:hypothetical protein
MDISKIQINSTSYTIKDADARQKIEALIANLEEGGYGIRVVNGGTP